MPLRNNQIHKHRFQLGFLHLFLFQFLIMIKFELMKYTFIYFNLEHSFFMNCLDFAPGSFHLVSQLKIMSFDLFPYLYFILPEAYPEFIWIPYHVFLSLFSPIVFFIPFLEYLFNFLSRNNWVHVFSFNLCYFFQFIICFIDFFFELTVFIINWRD